MSDFLQINQNGHFPLEAVWFVSNQEHLKYWNEITIQLLSFTVYGIDMPFHLQHLACQQLLSFTCTLSCPLGLVLAGTELFLFTGAGMRLFRIHDEHSVDKTRMCSLFFRSVYQCQSLFPSSHCSLSEEAGSWTRSWEWTQLGHKWPELTRS